MVLDRSPSTAIGEREALVSPTVDFFLVLGLCTAAALASVAFIVP